MTGQKPGPRPTGRNLKTSVRVLGDRVDDFEALCHLLRRKPHELAGEMVLEAINTYRADPEIGPRVAALADARRQEYARRELLERGRAHPSGFRLVDGGAS